jgi:mono/diheme cytochrome c family protein
MSKKIVICAVLVFFALPMSLALSEMVYPQELMEVSAPYPEATIVQTTNASGTVMVAMESNDNLDSILEYYKNELPANGWTISAETRQQGAFRSYG